MSTNSPSPTQSAVVRGCTVAFIILSAAPSLTTGASPQAGIRQEEPGRLAVTADIVISAGDDDESPLFINVSSGVVDSRGHVYLADPALSCLHEFAADGRYLAKLGQSGEGPGDLMPAAVLAIDGQDRLVIAGVGGRVDFLGLDGTYLSGFERENPASAARSVAVAPDGSVIIAATDMLDGTILDHYSPTHAYVRSSGRSFAAGKDLDWRFESVYAGGYVDCDADGNIYFLQLAPFDLVKSSPEGMVIRSTTAGLDFVPFPPEPDVSDDRFRVYFTWATTGVAVLADGRVICSAYRRISASETRSRLYLFDQDLNLIASREFDDLHTVVGADRRGSALIFINDDTTSRVIVGRVERESS